MKLIKNNVAIEVNEQAQLISFVVDGISLLHDGKKDWNKIFPIIFPVLANSIAYEHKGKKYKLPRHGFWNELNWDGYAIDDVINMQAIVMPSVTFPFSIDINIKFKVIKNGISISTTFTNFGREDAFIHFGYHPAFVTDETSTLTIGETPLAIDLEGKLTKNKINVKKLSDLEFGKQFDTLVYKNIKQKKATLKNKSYSLEVTFNSKNLQLWKPTDASFICIEPWEGANDQEGAVISKVSKKKDILKLESTASKEVVMQILYKGDVK